jgi:hypothetical protein
LFAANVCTVFLSLFLHITYITIPVSSFSTLSFSYEDDWHERILLAVFLRFYPLEDEEMRCYYSARNILACKFEKLIRTSQFE